MGEGENKWELLKIFRIEDAQPAQCGQFGANAHSGRASGTFKNIKLPDNVFVCGDHQATATLNGAFEAGLNVAQYLL
jgi:hypothetical protein